MTIGWDRKMNKPANITEILPAKIMAKSQTARRLKEVYLTNEDSTYSAKMELLDALEIKIIDEDGNKLDFTWSVQGFDQDFFWI